MHGGKLLVLNILSSNTWQLLCLKVCKNRTCTCGVVCGCVCECVCMPVYAWGVSKPTIISYKILYYMGFTLTCSLTFWTTGLIQSEKPMFSSQDFHGSFHLSSVFVMLFRGLMELTVLRNICFTKKSSLQNLVPISTEVADHHELNTAPE